MPEGDAVILGAQEIAAFSRAYTLTDLSSDGSRVAFRSYAERLGDAQYFIGVIDVITGATKTFPVVDYPSTVVFSPDGDRLLVRVGAILRIFDITTGSASTLAEVPTGFSGVNVFWLSDGRILYPDRERRLMFVVPGQKPHRVGLRIPDPRGPDDLLASFAVDPSGTRIAYARGCHAFLLDLESEQQVDLGSDLFVPANAWSPAGTQLALQHADWYGRRDVPCRYWSGPPYFDLLYDWDGTLMSGVLGEQSGLSHGHGISWSEDGRYLLVTDNPTGTQTTGLTALHVVDTLARERTMLVPYGLTSEAFVTPDHKIVFAVYHHDTYEVSSGRDSGGVWIGTLVP